LEGVIYDLFLQHQVQESFAKGCILMIRLVNCNDIELQLNKN